MGTLENNNLVWTVAMELGVLFAAGSAIWRIVYKFRWLRLWYDDLSAGVAATGCLAMIFLISIASETSRPEVLGLCIWASINIKVLVMWSTRLEAIMSIARVYLLRRRKLHTVYFLAAILLFVIFPPVIFLSNYSCAKDESWLLDADPVCPLAASPYLTAISIEFIIDILLALSPFHVAKDLTQRKQILVVSTSFSSTTWVLLINIATTVVIFRAHPLKARILLLLMDITIIVCVLSSNIATVAGCLYRRMEPPSQAVTQSIQTWDRADTDPEAAQAAGSTIDLQEFLQTEVQPTEEGLSGRSGAAD